MRRISIFLFVAFAVIYATTSCTKSDSAPIENPTPPVITPKDSLGAGWSRVLNDSGNYIDIYFTDSANGYLISSRSVLKSTNGGVNWSRLYTSPDNLFNIAMASPQKLLIAGTGSVTYSTDGGNSFRTINAQRRLYDCYYLGSDKYIMTGANGIYSTNDNGATINTVLTRATNSIQSFVNFSDSLHGWVSFADSVYRTSDGGSSWQGIAKPAGNIMTLDFLNANVGYGNVAGRIYKTTDGGTTWQQRNFIRGDTSAYLDIDFVSENVGFVTNGSSVFKTTDGGISWSRQLFLTSDIIEIHFIDENHGWLCDSKGVLRYVR